MEYCFFRFRFADKKSAAEAIVGLHGTEIAGHVCKCAWGKEAGDPSSSGYSGSSAGSHYSSGQYSQGGAGYYNNGQMQQGYWYGNPQQGYGMQGYGNVPYGGGQQQQGYNYQYQG